MRDYTQSGDSERNGYWSSRLIGVTPDTQRKDNLGTSFSYF